MHPALAPITAVGALLVGSCGIVAAVVHEPDPGYPSAWDDRVLDLVEFVEDERDHDFEHPVEIEFLSADQYAERTRTDPAALTDEEIDEAEAFEGVLRALGLVAGDIDLLESSDDLTDTGTLAYYDSEREVVTVRGTEVTPSLAVTLVHELTHVLQDQIFDLERLADEEATSGELAAFRALAEGDAGRIEARYYESLGADQQAAVDDEQAVGIESMDEAAIPDALEALFGLPYILGESLLATLETEGDDAIDDAFEDPPVTEEHLLDPLSYLDGDGPIAVDQPDIGDVEVFDAGDFGAASLYLVLAARIDLRTALTAALGWGGDAYVNYLDDDDRSCVDLRVTGDEPSDVDELAAALDAWAAAGPAGAATATREGDIVLLHACDPGVEAAGAPNSAVDALIVAALRNGLAAGAIDAGASDGQARCFGDAVIASFTVEELTGSEAPADFDSRLADLAAGCL